MVFSFPSHKAPFLSSSIQFTHPNYAFPLPLCLSISLYTHSILNIFAQMICKYQVRCWRVSKVVTLFIYIWSNLIITRQSDWNCSRGNAKEWIRYNITLRSSLHWSHRTTSSSSCVLLHKISSPVFLLPRNPCVGSYVTSFSQRFSAFSVAGKRLCCHTFAASVKVVQVATRYKIQ